MCNFSYVGYLYWSPTLGGMCSKEEWESELIMERSEETLMPGGWICFHCKEFVPWGAAHVCRTLSGNSCEIYGNSDQLIVAKLNLILDLLNKLQQRIP